MSSLAFILKMSFISLTFGPSASKCETTCEKSWSANILQLSKKFDL